MILGSAFHDAVFQHVMILDSAFHDAVCQHFMIAIQQLIRQIEAFFHLESRKRIAISHSSFEQIIKPIHAVD